VQKRIGQIRSQLEDTDSDYDQEKTSRADRQTGGVAVIKVVRRLKPNSKTANCGLKTLSTLPKLL